MNKTEDLIQVRLQDAKVNIEDDINISLQSDVVSELMHTAKTTLISSMDKLYSNIDFFEF